MSAEAASLTTAEADGLLLAVVLDDETRQDPVPVYRRLLAESPRWESATGMTILAGYHDGLEYLRNPHWGRAEVDMDLPPTLNGSARRSDRDTTTMLFLNPPDHTRIRSLVARAFTPRRVEELRGRIDELLTPILDEPLPLETGPEPETPTVAQTPVMRPPAEPEMTGPIEQTPRRNVAKKRGRASVPSWDEIVFGARGED